MKRYLLYIVVAAISIGAWYVIYQIFYHIPRVGMGRNSHTVSESKERGVFTGYYKLYSASPIDEININTIFWSEKFYKTMSWDLSKSTVIDGLYHLYVEDVPRVNRLIRDNEITLVINCCSFQPDYERKIGVEFRSAHLPDTLIIKLFKGFKPDYESYQAADSFKLVRVK
jgi:hypothetical protein